MANWDDSGPLAGKSFRRRVWILIRHLHNAKSSDARWGTVQILLSFFFFFFGLAIAAISVYDASFGGKWAMIVALVLGGTGALFLGWAVWMAWHFFNKFDTGPILIVTNDKIEFDADNVRVEQNQLVITTKRHEIRISELDSERITDGKNA